MMPSRGMLLFTNTRTILTPKIHDEARNEPVLCNKMKMRKADLCGSPLIAGPTLQAGRPCTFIEIRFSDAVILPEPCKVGCVKKKQNKKKNIIY